MEKESSKVTTSKRRGELIQVRKETVSTDYGPVLVVVEGDRSKPAILTYHDLGFDYWSNFIGFFCYSGMTFLYKNFCVYHMNAPGQEENADNFPEKFEYPNMNQLAEQVGSVLVHFGLKRVIGFGVGAGANILCRFALKNPQMMQGLCVINCMTTAAGKEELNHQQKLANSTQKDKRFSSELMDFLIWHHFGTVAGDNESLANTYRNIFEQYANPHNLDFFMQSYFKRSDLGIDKPVLPPGTLPVPTLAVVGVNSAYGQDTVSLNSRLNPVEAQSVILQDCSMVMEEQPNKLVDALYLFLQELGYSLPAKTQPPEEPASFVRNLAILGTEK